MKSIEVLHDYRIGNYYGTAGEKKDVGDEECAYLLQQTKRGEPLVREVIEAPEARELPEALEAPPKRGKDS